MSGQGYPPSGGYPGGGQGALPGGYPGGGYPGGPGYPPSHGEAPPPPPSRNWMWIVGAFAVVLLPCCCCCGFGLFGATVPFVALMNLPVYEQAGEIVRTSPEVQAALGAPVEVGFPRQTSINYDPSGGHAEFSMGVSGAHGTGTVQAMAREPDGRGWRFDSLVLVVDETQQRIDLTPRE